MAATNLQLGTTPQDLQGEGTPPPHTIEEGQHSCAWLSKQIEAKGAIRTSPSEEPRRPLREGGAAPVPLDVHWCQ